jgi:hypothetical protein
MKLSFFGDISLFNIDSAQFRFCQSFENLLNESDFNIGNLECPITDNVNKEARQAVHMHASVNSLNLLKPFQIVSLSNNHIRDFQKEGITDTINALKEFNIRYFGIGKTQEEAVKPLLIEKDGFKIALLGATRYANASENNGGGTAKDSFYLIGKQIKKLKKDGCFVIPYFHWGYEYVRIPSPRERKLAHQCIDAGADIIIGSHPHIYQGIEEYRGKKIVYSLGNFIFHSSVFDGLAPIQNDPRLNESFFITIEISKDFSYKTSIYGYKTEDRRITLYSEKENEILIRDVNKISNVFNSKRWTYLKAYYEQTYEISKQNIKVRKDFQAIDKLSLREKIKIYKTANIQDLKNRIAGLVLPVLKKF